MFVVKTVVGHSGEVPAHPACYEHEYWWSTKSCLCTDGYQGLLLCCLFTRWAVEAQKFNVFFMTDIRCISFVLDDFGNQFEVLIDIMFFKYAWKYRKSNYQCRAHWHKFYYQCGSVILKAVRNRQEPTGTGKTTWMIHRLIDINKIWWYVVQVKK